MTAHISDDGSDREESVAEHTQKTVFLCSEKGKRCGMTQIMSLCGILHDMGKNKQKFYDYIHAGDKERKKLRGSIGHASTGAKYIYDRYHENTGKVKVLTELIAYAVAAHHGLFDCVNEERKDLFSAKLFEVEDYDEACGNAEKDYLEQYELEKIFTEAEREFERLWEKMKKQIEKMIPLLKKTVHNKKEIIYDCRSFLFACLQRLVLSVLIDADWEATSDFMKDVNTLSKHAHIDNSKIFAEAGENFETYMRKKRSSIQSYSLTDREKSIMEGRNKLQEECREFAKHPAGIYCLPIPTGGGKTLSSLAYALEYCKCHPETERIIYVSPYISITEQNAKVFREAIGKEEWILEHHSSVIKDVTDEDEDYHKNRFAQLDINWDEPFICTTFVQFMNTLFSEQSKSVRRMHRLVNSVIIIDEVQSMPLKCIHTFNQMMNFLNAVCNADIILCTATQPALGEALYPVCYSEPKYMVKDTKKWFARFERVKIHSPEPGQKYTFESLGNEIISQTDSYHSILVILNTKSAVGKLYDILKTFPIHVEYLTTNLCAEHRSDKIEAIKELLRERRERVVVVSTNLIEAGVDISFECVYRSMTGLDSLAQSAGRCNRNGELESGNVHLIQLDGENIGNMEELQQNIRVAEEVIYWHCKNSGEDSLLMPKWMNEYFQKVYLNAEDKMNFPIHTMAASIMELLSKGFCCADKKNIMNQAYKTAGREYRVIDENSFGVIVPYKEGSDILEAIRESSDLSKIKGYIRKAQRYTVNVRQNQLKKFDGLIQRVNEHIPGLYMVAAPGAYTEEHGITTEWEPLIF